VSTTSREVAVAPEAIWAVLADASTYARWVVGVTRILRVDPAWPTPGSTFAYTFRYGPFTLRGRATVLEAHGPRHLRVRWRRRWRGITIAEFRVEPAIDPAPDRSVIRMREEATGLFAGLAESPLAGAHAVTTLARLERLIVRARGARS
jgi:uncharacterized protein YndB with AHSA1/START domain